MVGVEQPATRQTVGRSVRSQVVAGQAIELTPHQAS
jgi:hypothetical protein